MELHDPHCCAYYFSFLLPVWLLFQLWVQDCLSAFSTNECLNKNEILLMKKFIVTSLLNWIVWNYSNYYFSVLSSSPHGGGSSPHNGSTSTLNYCGAEFCVTNSNNNGNLQRPPDSEIYQIMTIYLACIVGAVILIALIVDPLSRWVQFYYFYWNFNYHLWWILMFWKRPPLVDWKARNLLLAIFFAVPW